MQAMCATSPMHQQEPVVLKSAFTNLPNGTKIEPMTTPKDDMVVNTISLYNATMGIANTSPVNHTADGGLLESNYTTDDTKDGIVEEWLLVMKRYLERVYVNSSPVDKAWAIIDHLSDEARSCKINKPHSERHSHEKACTVLSSRLGTENSRCPVRQAFRLRNQLEKEDLMQY